MLEVISALYTFYQHIIDVHLHGVLDKVLEDFVYYPLEGILCILKSEGNHLVAVFPNQW